VHKITHKESTLLVKQHNSLVFMAFQNTYLSGTMAFHNGVIESMIAIRNTAMIRQASINIPKPFLREQIMMHSSSKSYLIFKMLNPTIIKKAC